MAESRKVGNENLQMGDRVDNKSRLSIGGVASLRGQLLRGGVGSGFAMAANALLTFLLAILLARTLGADGYGVYAFVLSLVSVLAVPAQFGLPQLVVRETARAHANERWDLMKGIWQWSTRTACLLSIATAVVAGLAAWYFSDRLSQEQLRTFFWGLFLVPLIALGNLRGAALRGLRKVVQGQLPEQVLRPLFFIVLIVLSQMAARQIAPPLAMALYVVAAAAAFLFGTWLLLRERPPQLKAVASASYEKRRWRASTLPLAFVAGMHLISNHTDLLMLGIFGTVEEVGAYKVASQAAILVVFGLQAANAVIAPQFTRLYALGEMQVLQRLVTVSARVIVIGALPIVAAFIIFGEQLLVFAFGAEYAVSAVPLSILAAGKFVAVAMGSVGFLLVMTDNEKDVARSTMVAAISNVLLNLLLIPRFGMSGAAVATAISWVVSNLMLWWAVRVRLGIESTAFGPGILRRREH